MSSSPGLDQAGDLLVGAGAELAEVLGRAVPDDVDPQRAARQVLDLARELAHAVGVRRAVGLHRGHPQRDRRGIAAGLVGLSAGPAAGERQPEREEQNRLHVVPLR
jgi:hypothetical protein